VGDCFGADVLTAAFIQFAAFFLVLIMQAHAAIGIFEVVFKSVVFPYISGHSAPSFPVFRQNKKRPLRSRI